MNKMIITDRNSAVAGTFYSRDKHLLKSQLKDLFDQVAVKTKEKLAALIVPHAGYAFSGKVAAKAYSKIDRQKKFDNIFIIGSSHHISFKGASIYNIGNYITPLGMIKVNLDLANQLINSSSVFKYKKDAHSEEHSIEVQLPFLQYWLDEVKQIVPIVIGTKNIDDCKQIANTLKPFFNKKNLFIISSDFSHYPSDSIARDIDHITSKTICKNSAYELLSWLTDVNEWNVPNMFTSLCGWTSVLTLLYITEKDETYSFKPVSYMNSSESVNYDTEKVVGYQSIMILRNINDVFTLGDEEKNYLLNHARSSILKCFGLKKPNSSLKKYDFSRYRSAFVSVYVKDELRGCIGCFDDVKDLEGIVEELAIHAAFSDSRFEPIEKRDLLYLSIEISVLSPKRQIESIDEIELGKHGVYIKKGKKNGTFLPQVALKNSWTKEEFLGHLSKNKANIGWNGWKEADIYIYDAIVFSD